MTRSATEDWLASLKPGAKAHRVNEVFRLQGVSRMKTKCGKDMRQTPMNVGTIWDERVTCAECLKALSTKPVEEGLQAVDDDDLEW